jgi:hypothetical protein
MKQTSTDFSPYKTRLDMEAAMAATTDFDRATARAADGRPAWMPPGVSFWHPRQEGLAGAWGRGFVNTPRLRTLALTLEAPEAARADVERLVQWAVRTWHMPLNPALSGGWHFLCPDAAIERTAAARGHACQGITFLPETPERRAERLRAPLCTWTIRWTRRRYEGPEVFPYGGAVTVVPGVDLLDDGEDSDIELCDD